MTNTLYDALGIDKDATPDEIRRAYLVRAAETHPDKPDNEEREEEFKDVGIAYQVLSIPQRRRDYDETGFVNQMSEDETLKQEALSRIEQMFIQFVEELGPQIFTVDAIQAMVDKCDSASGKLAERVRRATIGLAQWDKISGRIEFNGPGQDPLANTCAKQIQGLRDEVEMVRHESLVAERVQRILAGYTWEYEQFEPEPFGRVGAGSPLGRFDTSSYTSTTG